MIIKLKHEKHGFHHVYSLDELAKCKSAGWTEADIISETAENVTIKEEPKRRGRPCKKEG